MNVHKNARLTPFGRERVVKQVLERVVLNVKDYSAIDSAFALQNDVASVGAPTGATLAPWTTFKRLLEYDLPRWAGRRNTTASWGVLSLVRWYIAWTINDKDKLECLCEAGVSGVLTDDIPLLRQLAQAKGRL